MRTKIKNLAVVVLPIASLKCLYATGHGEKIVCEIDVSELKKVNEPNTIDEMVGEARLEYLAGKTKSFTDSKKLVRYLNR